MESIKKIAIIGIVLFHAVMMFIFNMENLGYVQLFIAIGVVSVVDLILSVIQISGNYQSTRQFMKAYIVYALEKVFIGVFEYILYYNCSTDYANGKMELLGGALIFSAFRTTCLLTMAGSAAVMLLVGMIKTRNKPEAA